jgi:anthranilate phosphoribosyltransferase
MSIAPYLREIGRGKDGARALSAAQAEDLMTQVLASRVSDLELGAFCVAMRIKGETPAELAGFLAATRAHCLAPPSARTAVWLPSYNGARKLPNLTPLLALLLAREGVPVLVHGPTSEPGRTASAEIFQRLGLAPAHGVAEIGGAWRRGEPVFVPTERMCAPLARLLLVRRVVGLRNPGHTVAKLLHPPPDSGSPAFRVVNHTHPEYAQLLGDFLAESRAHAMLLRGTEGEPVADARRTPRMDVYCDGARHEGASVAARGGVLTHLPELPRSIDAASTATYITAVLRQQLPTPEPIALQLECILRALAGADVGAEPGASLAA